ncbi:MAG TPA: phosphomannomutase/phosphoglucomutase [Thermoanaerobaculia bacterium]|jgi:phosphomannomutase|nr:phosphomannomutase/phosphoglucomutase [Thermoanaerobaculia bacterium]
MSGIFKAYDVRGIYPSEINAEVARQIGLAFQHVLDAGDRAHGNTVVVSRDMRGSSPVLASALIDGITEAGFDVLDIGLASTPMNYFAIGHTGAAGGVQVTASHNPAQYNGFKFSRHGARPVSGDHGIELMESKIAAGDLPAAARPGVVRHGEVTADYRKHVLGFLEPAPAGRRRLKVAIDAANGMVTIDRPILDAMGIEILPLYFELDGSFPNHEPNPLKEENLRDLSRAVRDGEADFGAAFDGDADRVGFVDERGEPIPNDLTTGLIGGELLAREPGKAVIYDLRSSRAVAEYISEHGGVPVRERVGHSFMKATLRERHGIFGGELAGHYYFRDHYYADCAILALVEVLNLRRQTGEPLSRLVAPLARYHKSPEINFVVEDKAAKIALLAAKYADASIDYLDGITLSYPDWWANVRPSNTEPYLRLVLEAKTAADLARRRAELTALLGTPETE